MLRFKIIGLLVLEKKFFKVFTIYGHGGHLGHVTWTIHINFRSPFQGLAVSEKKTFENVNGRTDDDGRTPDQWVSYKLTSEPSAQVS